MQSPLRSIIVPLIPGRESPALAWGGRIARDFGARADAAYIRRSDQFAALSFGPTYSAYPSPTVIEELREAEREAEGAAQALFEKAKSEPRGAALGRFIVLDELADEGVVRAARSYDLGVTLLPGGPASTVLADTLTKLVLQAGAPVFAAPEELPADAPLDAVMLAWDGGREASHAMRASLPFLERARSVEIVYLGTPHRDNDSIRSAAAYLEAHGISPSATQSRLTDSVGRELLELAEGAGANLLVMGAYGHPRWLEQMFGGATHDVLRKSGVPLLMAH
jgi:nucleotide-binding universal stress UspA family protein